MINIISICESEGDNRECLCNDIIGICFGVSLTRENRTFLNTLANIFEFRTPPIIVFPRSTIDTEFQMFFYFSLNISE